MQAKRRRARRSKSSSPARRSTRPLGGFVGVSNVGRDRNWLGHHLAHGEPLRLRTAGVESATLVAATIADEWTQADLRHDPRSSTTITSILLESWPAYENYTGPLGIGTLTDIIGVHYGPASSRPSATAGASGIAPTTRASAWIARWRPAPASSAQYSPRAWRASTSRSRRCPDELLLFMHHVPYTHRLQLRQDGHSAHLRLALSGRGAGGRFRRHGGAGSSG